MIDAGFTSPLNHPRGVKLVGGFTSSLNYQASVKPGDSGFTSATTQPGSVKPRSVRPGSVKPSYREVLLGTRQTEAQGSRSPSAARSLPAEVHPVGAVHLVGGVQQAEDLQRSQPWPAPTEGLPQSVTPPQRHSSYRPASYRPPSYRHPSYRPPQAPFGPRIFVQQRRNWVPRNRQNIAARPAARQNTDNGSLQPLVGEKSAGEPQAPQPPAGGEDSAQPPPVGEVSSRRGIPVVSVASLQEEDETEGDTPGHGAFSLDPHTVQFYPRTLALPMYTFDMVYYKGEFG